MVTTILAPGPALAPYVANYWLQTTARAGSARERVLPSGASELVVDLTAPRLAPLLIGPRTTPLTMHRAPREAWLGIHFRPGGAGVLLGVPERTLVDLQTAAALVSNAWALDWTERLAGAQTPAVAARVLDALLLGQLKRARAPRTEVVAAITAFSAPDRVCSVGAMVQRSGLSSRRFITVFGDHTGFTPKTFARLQRFRRAVQTLHRDPARGGADVALACGYFDQSHMNREFRAFAGLSPGRYARAPTGDPFHVADT